MMIGNEMVFDGFDNDGRPLRVPDPKIAQELARLQLQSDALRQENTRLRGFVERVSQEKGEYGRMGYNQPTQLAFAARALLAAQPAAKDKVL